MAPGFGTALSVALLVAATPVPAAAAGAGLAVLATTLEAQGLNPKLGHHVIGALAGFWEGEA